MSQTIRDNNYGSVLIRKEQNPAAVAVLVKFNFTNKRWIPAGIPEKGRQSDADMDRIHADIAATTFENPALGEIGRYRPGRVDTGEATVNNALEAHAGLIRRGLYNNGYVLADLNWFENRGKFVVVAAFRPVSPDVTAPKLSEKTVTALRALSTTTWNFCHVWENPNGVVTVNFVGRNPDKKPARSIVIRNGAIEVDLVEALLPEQEEDELAMNAAYALWMGQGFNPHASDTQQVAGKVAEAVSRGE